MTNYEKALIFRALALLLSYNHGGHKLAEKCREAGQKADEDEKAKLEAKKTLTKDFVDRFNKMTNDYPHCQIKDPALEMSIRKFKPALDKLALDD